MQRLTFRGASLLLLTSLFRCTNVVISTNLNVEGFDGLHGVVFFGSQLAAVFTDIPSLTGLRRACSTLAEMEETANMAHHLNGNLPVSERPPVDEGRHYHIIKKNNHPSNCNYSNINYPLGKQAL